MLAGESTMEKIKIVTEEQVPRQIAGLLSLRREGTKFPVEN